MRSLFVAGAIATSVLTLQGCGGGGDGNVTTTAKPADEEAAMDDHGEETPAEEEDETPAEEEEEETPAEEEEEEQTPAEEEEEGEETPAEEEEEETPAEEEEEETPAEEEEETPAEEEEETPAEEEEDETPAEDDTSGGSRCTLPAQIPMQIHSIASVTNTPKAMPEGMPAPGPTNMEMWMTRTGDLVDCNMKMRMKTTTEMTIPGIGEMTSTMKMISTREGNSGTGFMVMDTGMAGVPVTCQAQPQTEESCDMGPPQAEDDNCETEKNVACPEGVEGQCDMWKFPVNGIENTFYFKAGTNDMAAMITDSAEALSSTIYTLYDDETPIPDSQFEVPAEWGCASEAVTV